MNVVFYVFIGKVPVVFLDALAAVTTAVSCTSAFALCPSGQKCDFSAHLTFRIGKTAFHCLY